MNFERQWWWEERWYDRENERYELTLFKFGGWAEDRNREGKKREKGTAHAGRGKRLTVLQGRFGDLNLGSE